MEETRWVMKHICIEEHADYIFALGLLKGVGPRAQRLLVSYFPTQQRFQQASLEELEKIFPPPSARSLHEQVHQSPHVWAALLQKAADILQQHIQAEIFPIPITSSTYPPLLKKIPDPPVILYAKGNLALLQETNAVAIVGTREPTPKGERVAQHLARHFAQFHYCIISGLAKGIDTAAHEGALEVHGRTIAVFGTPLNQVYPAVNKGLANRILEAEGLLISEAPLGQRGFRSAFVSRDRIQSGLSLAVIPVQTKIDGGTMHTVNFAHVQKRLIACPVPLQGEGNASQYEGIYALMRGTNPPVYTFKAGQVESSDILDQLERIKRQLYAEKSHEQRNKTVDSRDAVKQEVETTSKPSEANSSAKPAKSASQPRKPKSSSQQKSSESHSRSSISYETFTGPSASRVAEPKETYQSGSCCVQAQLW
jgi:DNA processing protein